jgi:hypothetical protein
VQRTPTYPSLRPARFGLPIPPSCQLRHRFDAHAKGGRVPYLFYLSIERQPTTPDAMRCCTLVDAGLFYHLMMLPTVHPPVRIEVCMHPPPCCHEIHAPTNLLYCTHPGPLLHLPNTDNCSVESHPLRPGSIHLILHIISFSRARDASAYVISIRRRRGCVRMPIGLVEGLGRLGALGWREPRSHLHLPVHTYLLPFWASSPNGEFARQVWVHRRNDR